MFVWMPSVGEKFSGRGLSGPVVVRYGVLLQFWTKPEDGLRTWGRPSNRTYEVQRVSDAFPGRYSDQS